MAGVRQAVLDFDDAVQVPWRPRLRAVPVADDGATGRRPRPPVSRAAVSRVGACRPESVRAADDGAAGPVGSSATRPGPARPGQARPGPARPAGAAVPGPPAGRPVRGGCGRVRRRPGPGVRLTRRARRLAVVLALGVGVALGSWLGPLVAGDTGDLRLVGERSVVVQAGDTVWSIAADFAGPDEDVRAVVDVIEELNELDGARVVPGQVLLLP
ncbi:LysM peptidoglycan-binding domain-containing protein [Geodermatophilus sp. SYSU D01105]